MALINDPKVTGEPFYRAVRAYEIAANYQAAEEKMGRTTLQDVRKGLKDLVYFEFGVDDRQGLENTSVSFIEYASRHGHSRIVELVREEICMSYGAQPERQKDESPEQYERRMLMWHAAQETRRQEARADRRALLRSAILCAVLALGAMWGVGIAAFFGFGHPGIVWPGIVTALILAIASVTLFCKFSGIVREL